VRQAAVTQPESSTSMGMGWLWAGVDKLTVSNDAVIRATFERAFEPSGPRRAGSGGAAGSLSGRASGGSSGGSSVAGSVSSGGGGGAGAGGDNDAVGGSGAAHSGADEGG
jgi:hypothetical protein